MWIFCTGAVNVSTIIIYQYNNNIILEKRISAIKNNKTFKLVGEKTATGGFQRLSLGKNVVFSHE